VAYTGGEDRDDRGAERKEGKKRGVDLGWAEPVASQRKKGK